MSGNGRLQAAINSLELALHENTNDSEVMAGINAFRRIAKGRILTDICKDVYGGRYDGRTLPEYREEWQAKFEQQACEIQRLRRSEIELRRHLDDRAQVVASLTRNEANLRSKLEVAEQARKDALAQVKVSKRSKPASDTPVRRPLRQPLMPVVMNSNPPTEFLSRSGKKVWTRAEQDFLVGIHLEDVDCKNKELAARCTGRFGRTITENAIRGMLNTLRAEGRVARYRPGRERQRAAA